jgi:hypothetical protein
MTVVTTVSSGAEDVGVAEAEVEEETVPIAAEVEVELEVELVLELTEETEVVVACDEAGVVAVVVGLVWE